MSKIRPYLSEKALWGIGGEITKRLCENAESDPAGVIHQLYVFAGNIMGRKCYVEAESNKIFPNMYLLVVGDSSLGRKGTSYNLVKSVIEPELNDYLTQNVKSGLFSGQGLTFHLRDEIKDAKGSIIDEGVKDKRLLVKEAEFASCLNAGKIDASILSTTLRDAYDSGNLSNLTKNSSLKATNPHVSIIGHITPTELSLKLSAVDIANGFANRFLFVFVERQKAIVNINEAKSDMLNGISWEIKNRIEYMKPNGRVRFSEEGLELWRKVYLALSVGCPGVIGSLNARATTHITKLSLIISILNQEEEISYNSLIAAIHLWQYCSDSINFLFANSLGDEALDTLYSMIQDRPEGLSRSEIHSIYSRNRSKQGLSQMLKALESQGLIFSEKIKTAGAPKELWKTSERIDESTILTKKGGLISFLS
jgi:hypothetical protein